jgi:hypothetical protein
MSKEHKSLSSKLLSYCRYSGVSVIVALNPLWWKVVPWARRERSDWPGPNEHTWAVGFLGVTVRIWIDDGSW